MKKLSKERIRRILKSHCVTVKASLFSTIKDEYGDAIGSEKYLDCTVYFSALLHRYNPYVGYNFDDIATTYKRHTPMAILPYDEPINISNGDILKIEGKEYTIRFSEDIKGYYYLLSLSSKEEEVNL